MQPFCIQPRDASKAQDMPVRRTMTKQSGDLSSDTSIALIKYASQVINNRRPAGMFEKL